jgi:hypothetical protein
MEARTRREPGHGPPRTLDSRDRDGRGTPRIARSPTRDGPCTNDSMTAPDASSCWRASTPIASVTNNSTALTSCSGCWRSPQLAMAVPGVCSGSNSRARHRSSSAPNARLRWSEVRAMPLPLSHSARSLMARAQAEAQAGNRDSVTLEHLVLRSRTGRNQPRGSDRGTARRRPGAHSAGRQGTGRAPKDEEPRDRYREPFVPHSRASTRSLTIWSSEHVRPDSIPSCRALRSSTACSRHYCAAGTPTPCWSVPRAAGKTAVMRGLAYAIAEGSAPTPLLGARAVLDPSAEADLRHALPWRSRGPGEIDPPRGEAHHERDPVPR